MARSCMEVLKDVWKADTKVTMTELILNIGKYLASRFTPEPYNAVRKVIINENATNVF